MQVTVEEVSPVEKKLLVSVPWATVESRMGDAFRELGKGVQLKGFRKGKVPRSVLEKMFGKRVRAEVAGQLVRESFLTAVTEHKLEPVSEPRLEENFELENGKPFSFAAIVEVRGEIELADWKGMKLGRRPVTIADKAVETALTELQREQTELRPIEGREVLAESDIVAIACKGTVGDHPIDRPQLLVDLGEPEHEPLPGLRQALIGLPIATEEKELELAIPADVPQAELAGQTAKITVSVLDAREKDVPAIDDELAKDTGRAETLADLRGVLKAELEQRMSGEVDDEVRKEALAELVKRNPIPVAGSLVERAIDNKWHRLRSMLGMQPGDGGELDTELREKLRASALDEVRGQLLLDAVATKEGIDVTEAEVDERVTKLARGQNQAPGRLRQEMDRDGRLESIRFQARQQKTLDLLVQHAEVTEREPAPPAPAESAAPDAAQADQPDK